MKFRLHHPAPCALLAAFTAGRLFGSWMRFSSRIWGMSFQASSQNLAGVYSPIPDPARSLEQGPGHFFWTVSRVTTGNRSGRPAGEWTARGRLNTAPLNSGPQAAMDRRGRSGSGLREGPGVGSSIPSRQEPRQKPTGGNHTDTRTASQSDAPTLSDLLAAAKGSQAFPAVYPPVRRVKTSVRYGNSHNGVNGNPRQPK